MLKFVWRLKSYQIPLLIYKSSMFATDFLRSLLCHLQFCSHENKRKKAWLVQNYMGMNKKFFQKEFIIKVCNVESECHFISSPPISPSCKSQEGCPSWFTKRKKKRNARACYNNKMLQQSKQTTSQTEQQQHHKLDKQQQHH